MSNKSKQLFLFYILFPTLSFGIFIFFNNKISNTADKFVSYIQKLDQNISIQKDRNMLKITIPRLYVYKIWPQIVMLNIYIKNYTYNQNYLYITAIPEDNTPHKIATNNALNINCWNINKK